MVKSGRQDGRAVLEQEKTASQDGQAVLYEVKSALCSPKADLEK